MINLYLMCGPAGSGKSTWIKDNHKDNYVIVSRDAVRFSMLKDTDTYFACEYDVFTVFINKIRNCIDTGYENIYVDATHLNEKSRNKVLDRLYLGGVNIIPVNMHTSLEKCIAQNDQRVGRCHVPITVIKDQYKAYEPASYAEKHVYKEIINV